MLAKENLFGGVVLLFEKKKGIQHKIKAKHCTLLFNFVQNSVFAPLVHSKHIKSISSCNHFKCVVCVCAVSLGSFFGTTWNLLKIGWFCSVS